MQSRLKAGSPRGTGIGKHTRADAGVLATFRGQHAGGRPPPPGKGHAQEDIEDLYASHGCVLTVGERNLRKIVDNKLGKRRKEVVQRGIGPRELSVDDEGYQTGRRKGRAGLIRPRQEKP